jgi:amidophosphoribosyltransferase
MSDSIKHECGIALVRLLQPLQYYADKYETALYGMDKLKLLMQKQRNRGQDGAGIATIKLDMPLGYEYLNRLRKSGDNYLKDLFDEVGKHFEKLDKYELQNADKLKELKPYIGELYLGHLRYATYGKNIIENCHPFIRQSNWITRTLIVAGNFNLTNVDELFQELVSYGQNPIEKSDTVTVMEKIGHYLDEEVQKLHTWFKPDVEDNQSINQFIYQHLDIQNLLARSAKKFDGGYAMAGLIGYGDAFVMRDPNGIRPAFYYTDEEVVVVASERPAIQTTFNVHIDKVKELQPGHALIIKKDGRFFEKPFIEMGERKACSFERIYFSRGTDRDIYLERKRLGELLTNQVLKAIDYDIENTIFSFIPNTAETSFYGLVEGLNKWLNTWKQQQIMELPQLDSDAVQKILNKGIRIEKLVVKDEKLRTFISDDVTRDNLVSHGYDVTYGLIRNELDTIVLLDDSIVRGTTMRSSILQMVGRLRPKRIIVVSAAPQLRYPDCYGIDISSMKEFVTFQALVLLLEETGQEAHLEKAYYLCKAQENLPSHQIKNEVKELYDLFTCEQITEKITSILTPKDFKPEVKVIFQKIEALHEACPNNSGDWYFSGDYPTPGGNKIVNKAFMNYMEKSENRAYA